VIVRIMGHYAAWARMLYPCGISPFDLVGNLSIVLPGTTSTSSPRFRLNNIFSTLRLVTDYQVREVPTLALEAAEMEIVKQVRRYRGFGDCPMTELERLERKIESLSPEELARFREWFMEFDWKRWDSKIEEDLSAGRLDRRISEATAEFEAGKAEEL
jgi:hypothetical protein